MVVVILELPLVVNLPVLEEPWEDDEEEYFPLPPEEELQLVEEEEDELHDPAAPPLPP